MSIRVVDTHHEVPKVVTCRDMIDAGLAIRDILFTRADKDTDANKENSHATA